MLILSFALTTMLAANASAQAVAFEWSTSPKVTVAAAAMEQVADQSWADGRFSGYLTIGCGDSFVKVPNAKETWFAGISEEQWREAVRLARVLIDERQPWTTLYVVLEGNERRASKRGFFGEHAKQLDITRVVSARYLEPGESANAAMEAKRYRGFALVGPESYGFVPFEQNDEFWWVWPGKIGWNELYEHFQPPPDLRDNPRLYNAVVEITGRVGPPGAYGHQNDFNREIAVDEITYIRAVDAHEMDGTAAVVNPDVPNNAAIDRCEPQRK